MVAENSIRHFVKTSELNEQKTFADMFFLPSSWLILKWGICCQQSHIEPSYPVLSCVIPIISLPFYSSLFPLPCRWVSFFSVCLVVRTKELRSYVINRFLNSCFNFGVIIYHLDSLETVKISTWAKYEWFWHAMRNSESNTCGHFQSSVSPI